MAESSDEDDDIWTLVFKYAGLPKIKLHEEWGNDELGLACSVYSGSAKLAEYLHEHKDLVRQRRVLELGSGCGGLGGIMSILLNASMTYLTDFPQVIPSLQSNVESNVPQGSNFKCIPLVWQNPKECGLTKDDVDIILGADCLYEKTVVEIFLNVILFFECEAIISGFVGTETYAEFLRISSLHFDVELISTGTEGTRSMYYLHRKSQKVITN
jgi:hypothetical protein